MRDHSQFQLNHVLYVQYIDLNTYYVSKACELIGQEHSSLHELHGTIFLLLLSYLHSECTRALKHTHTIRYIVKIY